MECFTDGVVYPWQRTLGCTKPETTAWTATSVMYADQFTTTVVAFTEETGSGAGFGAWGVQIRYRSEDISATATSATSSVATQTGSSTLLTSVSAGTASIASTTPSTGSSTSSTDGGDGKSSGSVGSAASAGIGIGCGAAVLVIAATLWYVLRLRRRLAQTGTTGAKQWTPTPTSDYSPQDYVYDPFSSEQGDLAQSPQMLGPSTFPAEVSGIPYHQRRAELSGNPT